MGRKMKKKPKFKKKQKFGDKIAVEESRQPSIPAPMPDIPVYDFYKDHRADTPNWDLGMFIDSLMNSIEDGYFLTWEAMIRTEQGLPLSLKQQDVLNSLVSFSDCDDEEPILYIDGIARPNEPWYKMLARVIPELILDPFKTYKTHDEVYHEGWLHIVECLEEHAQDLSLPDGVKEPLGVIPLGIRHRLWLQYCFDELSGLGQEEELTLANQEQKPWRIKGFIAQLRECKDSIEYLNLTLEDLFKLVILPQQDEEILIECLKENLKFKSEHQKLHEVL